VSTLTAAVGFVPRTCVDCGGGCLDYPHVEKPSCFDCTHARNEFAAKNIRLSVEDAAYNSTDPARIADGSAEYNMGLPGVPGEVIGTDVYGMTRRKMRPVHNNEITSGRKLREMAKRAGLTPLEAPKRAVGGK
jgi:hypothetical protein